MKTDRELLELAAKAANIEITRSRLDDPVHSDMLIENSARNITQQLGPWNPLTDDGDALRLAVKLRMDLNFEKLHTVCAWCAATDDWVTEYSDDGMGKDIESKTRRAIVRAAAAIGESL